MLFRSIVTNVKIVVHLFFYLKIEQDNIETTIENGKINLREINGEKH